MSPIEGIVEKGKIRRIGDIVLPENTRVRVMVTEIPSLSTAKIRSPHLADPRRAAELRKTVRDVS